MRGKAHRQGVVIAAQPARAGRFCGHQVSDRLRVIVLQSSLRWQCERLQITHDLPVMRGDKDQPFALRTLLQLEYALHGSAIARIATQAVTGFGGVGDEAAALEVRGKPAR